MRLTAKILSYLNRVFSKDPLAFLALRITCDSGQMTWQVNDGFLSLVPIAGTAQSITLDLSAYTIQDLAQFLSTQPGYSILYQDSSENQTLSALVLLDASGDISLSNGDHLFGYTSVLYSYVNAGASELERAQAQIPNMLEQMNTVTAEEEFLDLQGTYYDVPRNSVGAVTEDDDTYSPRIISNVLLPSSNNIGMAIALEAQFQGTSVIVADAVDNNSSLLLRDGSILFNSAFVHNSTATAISGGLFDVTFAFDFNGPIGFSEYAPMVIKAVDGYRMGGTYIRNLFLKNGITASVPTTSFDIGPVLVTVFDQPVIPADSIVTQGGLGVVTQDGDSVVTQQ